VSARRAAAEQDGLTVWYFTGWLLLKHRYNLGADCFICLPECIAQSRILLVPKPAKHFADNPQIPRQTMRLKGHLHPH